MSTEPNTTPDTQAADDAKAVAKARAIARARELAAARKAQQAAESTPDVAAEADNSDAAADDKAAAKARARELAAARKAQQAAETTTDVAAEAANSDAAADDKAAAKARAIARARELAAARKAQQAAETTTDVAAEAANSDAAADDKAAAKARAIARARELAAARKAQQAAETTPETAQEATKIPEGAADAKAAAKARALARAQELAAKRKVQAEAVESAPVEGVLKPGKPKQSSLFEIFLKGIWKDNPGLCQLLGMCPLLAVTTSAANALGLGIATILVLMLSSSVIALIRRLIVPEVRIPIYVIIIASLVTVVRFEVEATFPELYQQLGIYLSLIATNCIIMGRAEAFAGHNGVVRSLIDAIASGLGFTLVLFALGSIREIVGNGTWLVGASDLLGNWAAGFEMHLYSTDYTLLIAILPPGGFFVLAFLIAAKNALDGRAKRKAERRARIDVLNI